MRRLLLALYLTSAASLGVGFLASGPLLGAAPAQPAQPRLVVFESFNKPG